MKAECVSISSKINMWGISFILFLSEALESYFILTSNILFFYIFHVTTENHFAYYPMMIC